MVMAVDKVTNAINGRRLGYYVVFLSTIERLARVKIHYMCLDSDITGIRTSTTDESAIRS